MTVHGTDNGYYLGGLNGGYRNALAQAQSSAAQAAHYAYAGAISFAAHPATRPPLEDAGIRAGEIVAYRCWVLRSGLLHSMAASFAWIPGEIVKGDPSSGLGVHAFKTLGDAVGQYGSYASRDIPVVFGTVALWGDVIEHEKGYRAEFGAIDSIVMVMPGDMAHPKWKFWRKNRSILNETRKNYRVAYS